MILKELSWKDLLRLQPVRLSFIVFQTLTLSQTCKKIHSISKNRSIWLNLFERRQSCLRRPIRLEEPITAYTDAELEEIVKRLVSVEAGWLSNSDDRDLSNIEERSPRELSVSITFALVPGGRWLLSPMRYGVVNVYDLDKFNDKGRCLIEPSDELDQQSISAIRIDVDESSETLAFRVLVALTRQSVYAMLIDS